MKIFNVAAVVLARLRKGDIRSDLTDHLVKRSNVLDLCVHKTEILMN